MGQKKLGITISYFNLLFGTIINIIITPLLIYNLGDVDYSIYKVMQSFAGPLVIFNLGVSTIVTRSIVKYHTDEGYSEEDKKNTIALAMIVSLAMSIIVVIIGLILCNLIPSIYSKTYSLDELNVAQDVFVIFLFSTVLHLLTDVFTGCIMGNEKYAVNSSLALFKNILKLVLVIVLIKLGYGVKWIVAIDLIIASLTFIVAGAYSLFYLKEIPKIYVVDRKHILEITSFSLAIFLQAIVNQINNNIDVMILGAYINEKAIITMYSAALTIYNMYNSLVSVVTNFFLPKATKLITLNATGKELTDFVIKPGRFNAIIATGVICAFTVLGKEFITLWIGEKYIDAYYVTLILIIPVTIPLVINVAIAILDASLKRMYRSLVLFFMAGFNVIFSIVMIKPMGFWGVALGTAISLIIGHGILMNIYYAKTFKMEIGRMFCAIFKGIMISGISAMIICIPISMLIETSILGFIFKCICYCVIYALALYKIGMKDSEKELIIKLMKRNR